MSRNIILPLPIFFSDSCDRKAEIGVDAECLGVLRGPPRVVLMASRLEVPQDPMTSTCSFMMCLENPACRKDISAIQFWDVMFSHCFLCFLDLMR